MRCAVIILNWNGEKMLRQFLPFVVENTQLPDVELWVADNGSTDHSLEVLRTEFSTVRVLSFSENYGFAEGYNRAIEQIQADYVLLLNSDVETPPDWLPPMLDYMDAHPMVGAVQPKILAYRNKRYFEHAGAAGGYIDRYGYPYCRGRILSKVEEDNGQYDTIAEVFWASGACMLVRRQLYIDCGGLDALFFAHMEEIDLCWRMQSRGYTIACVPQSHIYHLGGGSLDYKNPRKTYLNFRNNLLMLYKNLPTVRLWRVMLMRFFLDYLSAFVYLLTGQFSNFKAVFRARRDFHRLRRSERASRQENLQRTTVSHIPTISSRSILWDSIF